VVESIVGRGLPSSANVRIALQSVPTANFAVLTIPVFISDVVLMVHSVGELSPPVPRNI
jgi:hypothetical protein